MPDTPADVTALLTDISAGDRKAWNRLLSVVYGELHALVGKAFGRRRIVHPWVDGKKTIEGSLAMFVVAGMAIFFTLLIYAGQPLHISFAVAILVAPVCSTVELFSHRGLDTLTVPLSAALAILSSISFLSLLGM